MEAVNSKLFYSYRDASNWKKFHDVIISGVINVDDITPFLYECQFFIPSVVGLPDLQNMPFRKDDHVWHGILEIETTTENATCRITAKELIDRFKSASQRDWLLTKGHL